MKHKFYQPLLKTFVLALLFLAGGYSSFAQCQTITVEMVSSDPVSSGSPDYIIRVCQNTPVTITANVTFADSVVPAMYIWSYGDESQLDTTNNLTMTHLYTEGGVYIVDLLVVTIEGECTNTNRLAIPIQVSTTPIFEGTQSAQDTICLNYTANLHGEVETVPGIYECAPPVADTTFLPDGSGVSYTTSIEVDCFAPGAVLTDGAQIDGICLSLEHSYLGDLDWKITCPNGQDAQIKQYPGGGNTYLGEPNDPGPGNNIPGVGYEYCFSDNAVWGTMLQELALGNTVPGVGNPAGNSMSPGSYKPVESFDALIGCPLNGIWTIEVTDHLGLDNGFIFRWEVDFDDALLPGSFSFLPEVLETNQGWLPHPDIIETTNNGHDITVKPTVGGLNCYTYQVTDDFNCSYDTTVCVWVVDAGNPGSDSTARLCLNQGVVDAFDYLQGTPDLGGVWSGIGVSPAGIFDPAVVGVGTYLLTYTLSEWQCDTTAVVTFNVVNDVIVDFDFSYGFGCDADTVHFNNLSEPGFYSWKFGDGTLPEDTTFSPTHVYENQNQYAVRLTVQNLEGCIDSVIKLVNVTHPLEADFTQSADSVCQSSTAPIIFTNTSVGNVQGWQWDFGDGTTSTDPNPSHTYTSAGVHQVRLIVNDDIPCYDTFYSTVYVDSLPHIELTLDKHAICQGDQVNFSVDYLHTATGVDWDFGDGVHWAEARNTNHSYDESGMYWATVTAHYAICPSVSATDSIVVNFLPKVDLGPDTALCLDGRTIVLQDVVNNSLPGTSWLWNTGDTTSSLRVTTPATYSLQVTRNNCSASDDIIVAKDCYTDVPNAFTPNNDGENDYFYPRQFLTKGVTQFEMRVWNRWGQVMFETQRTDGRGWDGRFNDQDQPMGVYIYQIDVTYESGHSESYTGNVTLIR